MATLLVNADDFGLHKAVNQAIGLCVDFGSVNSISVIANGAEPDFAALKTFSSKGVFTGAHLTWVGEPWLTDKNFFKDWRALIRHYIVHGKKFRRKLYEEAEAQILRLTENGVPLNHIDSHQHVHHFPGIWGITLALKEKYKIPRIRVAKTKAEAVRQTLSGLILNQIAGSKARHTSFLCAGIKYAGNYSVPRLEEELQINAGTTTELIVHPGTSNQALNERYSSWNFNWQDELAALTDTRFIEAVKANGFVLERKPLTV